MAMTIKEKTDFDKLVAKVVELEEKLEEKKEVKKGRPVKVA